MTTIRPNFDKTLPPGPAVAHQLDGDYDSRGRMSQPGDLRGAGILKSQLLTDEQSTRIRAILTATDSFGGEGMKCFMPGVGFTIGSGPEAVEILVCLECYWTYLFHGETRKIKALSEAGHRQLAGFYSELFPGNDTNTA